MRELQGVADALRDGRGLVGGEQAVVGRVEQLGEARPVDVLHDDVGVLVVVLELEHRDDVGVGEHARRARLGERGPQQRLALCLLRRGAGRRLGAAHLGGEGSELD